MERKYVRPTIGGWLRPVMFGPWISITAIVSAYAAFGPEHRFVGRWAVWAFGMIVGALAATAYTLLQVVVDVLLLSLRQRQLPVGRDAWLMSLGSPVLVAGVYALLPHDLYKHGAWAVVVALVAPVVVTVFGVRILAGQKVQKSAD
jgi:hypothetical protein